MDGVDIGQILAVLYISVLYGGVGIYSFRGHIYNGDVALMVATAHSGVEVRLPEGVPQLQKAALVGRIHVLKVVVLDYVLDGIFALFGFG